MSLNKKLLLAMMELMPKRRQEEKLSTAKNGGENHAEEKHI